MPIASFNLDLDPTGVAVGLLVAVAAVIATASSRKWLVAVFGTAAAWAAIAAILVTTASGDMAAIGLVLAVYAAAGAAGGAVVGPIALAIVLALGKRNHGGDEPRDRG